MTTRKKKRNAFLIKVIILALISAAIPFPLYFFFIRPLINGSGIEVTFALLGCFAVFVLVFAAGFIILVRTAEETPNGGLSNSYVRATPKTEDIWSEDRYLPCEAEAENVHVTSFETSSPTISTTVSPVQPDYESWDFDYEEEKREARRIAIATANKIPFENRFKSLQVLNLAHVAGECCQIAQWRKTSEPWEIYSGYKNYRLLSSQDESGERQVIKRRLSENWAKAIFRHTRVSQLGISRNATNFCRADVRNWNGGKANYRVGEKSRWPL